MEQNLLVDNMKDAITQNDMNKLSVLLGVYHDPNVLRDLAGYSALLNNAVQVWQELLKHDEHYNLLNCMFVSVSLYKLKNLAAFLLSTPRNHIKDEYMFFLIDIAIRYNDMEMLKDAMVCALLLDVKKKRELYKFFDGFMFLAETNKNEHMRNAIENYKPLFKDELEIEKM